jgi:hypothetical protein
VSSGVSSSGGGGMHRDGFISSCTEDEEEDEEIGVLGASACSDAHLERMLSPDQVSLGYEGKGRERGPCSLLWCVCGRAPTACLCPPPDLSSVCPTGVGPGRARGRGRGGGGGARGPRRRP